MPPSAPESPEPAKESLAVIAESLFVANLTVAPVAAFGVLAWLWLTRRQTVPPLARQHLDQAFHVSLRGGALLVIACAVIIFEGGLDWPWTWIVVVTYFTAIHSTLVICGCLALAKAMAGKKYRFPLIGPRNE